MWQSDPHGVRCLGIVLARNLRHLREVSRTLMAWLHYLHLPTGFQQKQEVMRQMQRSFPGSLTHSVASDRYRAKAGIPARPLQHHGYDNQPPDSCWNRMNTAT